MVDEVVDDVYEDDFIALDERACKYWLKLRDLVIKAVASRTYGLVKELCDETPTDVAASEVDGLLARESS